MSKSTWADVRKGDEIDAGGRAWRVVKIKPVKPKKGKKAKPTKARVMLEYRGRYAEDVVKLADKVKISKRGDGTKRGPLLDAQGVARRWATKKEADEAGVGLPPGDPEVTKPPAKPGPDIWETPHGKVERMLGDLMQARLVGETDDESRGYYVPPVDVSSIASHLVLFHGGIPDAVAEDEGGMLRAHEAQHAAALKGEGILPVNHWHTAKRPALDK